MAKKKNNIVIFIIISGVIIIGILIWGLITNWWQKDLIKELVKYKLKTEIPKGTVNIPITNPKSHGFEIGQKIKIGEGAKEEERIVVGFGSLILDRPLKYNHDKGTIITIISEPKKEFKPIEHCDIYDEKTTDCKTCKEGFYLQGNKCYKKMENCGSYDDNSTCKTCNDGFYLNNGTCIKCNENCDKCNSINNCIKCINDEFYLDIGTCKLKQNSGSICDDDTQCIDSCKDGYCCDKKNCMKCNYPGDCTECESQYYLDDGTCKSKKNSGGSCSNNGDNQCNSGLLCKDGYCCNQNNCTKCNNEGKCEECESQYYIDDDGTCKPKKNSGGSCSNNDDNQCNNGLLCKDGYCCSQNNCMKCNNEGKCTECESQYYVDDGTCKLKKNSGDSCSNNDDNQCIDSCKAGFCCNQNNCTKCNNQGLCTECITPGYYLDNGICNSWANCDSSKIKTIGTSTNNQECCDINPLHSFYSSTTPGDCTFSCNPEYYLDNDTCNPKKGAGGSCTYVTISTAHLINSDTVLDSNDLLGNNGTSFIHTYNLKVGDTIKFKVNDNIIETKINLVLDNNGKKYKFFVDKPIHGVNGPLDNQTVYIKDNQCLIGSCKDGYCCDQNNCTKCNNEGNCTECSTNYFLNNGSCYAKRNNGYDCTGNNQCTSNLCNNGKCCKSDDCVTCLDNDKYLASNNTCQSKKSDNDSCTDDIQCSSNSCRNDICFSYQQIPNKSTLQTLIADGYNNLSKIHSEYGPIKTWKLSNNLKDLSNLFPGCNGCPSTFNEDISGWDVSNVEKMNFMFAYASHFNQNLSNWNTSNVKTINSMFSYATAFNNGGQSLNWDTSNVTEMFQVFQGASSFNQDISTWNTSNVLFMSFMFDGASTFNNGDSATQSNIPLSWNTSSVKDMSLMFQVATNFNQDISAWDVSNVNPAPPLGFCFYSGLEQSHNPFGVKCN